MSLEKKGVYLLENVKKENKGLQDAEISVFDTLTCNRRFVQIVHNQPYMLVENTAVLNLCTCI